HSGGLVVEDPHVTLWVVALGCRTGLSHWVVALGCRTGLSHWATRSSAAPRQDGSPLASIQSQRAPMSRATAVLSDGRASRIWSTRPLSLLLRSAAARLRTGTGIPAAHSSQN